ncbi:prosaposin-like [Periophthalmus magnuspinnatus]|uniref:prosaposin-like n=1 Tax=Periophthalmus magnuspinnatus TaxID=409849 RepID=UPI00145A1D52|nr:prosaposin-like [Periophthalmus magnuspinnatus]
MACLPLALLLLTSFQTFDPIVAVNGLQLDNGSTENGNVCKDCTNIFELLADMLSSTELQKKIVDSVDGLCEHLPGPKITVKLCKEEVERMLSAAISFIGATKPAEMCKLLGLCQSCDKQLKMLNYFVNEALKAATASQNKNLCSFCLFLMKTLEDLLPKQRTEAAVIHLLEDICHILPPLYQRQCQDVVGKFSKTIIDAILSYATPRSICELLHLCKGQEETLLDPCIMEEYRCRDFSNALRCGTLFYCQKFAWKSVNTI